ncbi:hypothetical protein LAZ67_9000227 [Cordylochernes scorpioides]|uniref:Uncharacterized protein n=1 Tax=Cordylochernes scorpioides TaxID=51811 RepID=A0ABY6KSV2_9ARAC|nr:hypothetical protein LAZ67_9000227 [Cordylochernes scorpioides]
MLRPPPPTIDSLLPVSAAPSDTCGEAVGGSPADRRMLRPPPPTIDSLLPACCGHHGYSSCGPVGVGVQHKAPGPPPDIEGGGGTHHQPHPQPGDGEVELPAGVVAIRTSPALPHPALFYYGHHLHPQCCQLHLTINNTIGIRVLKIICWLGVDSEKNTSTYSLTPDVSIIPVTETSGVELLIGEWAPVDHLAQQQEQGGEQADEENHEAVGGIIEQEPPKQTFHVEVQQLAGEHHQKQGHHLAGHQGPVEPDELLEHPCDTGADRQLVATLRVQVHMHLDSPGAAGGQRDLRTRGRYIKEQCTRQELTLDLAATQPGVQEQSVGVPGGGHPQQARVPLQGYGGAVSVLMLESAAKASASMLGTASNYRQSLTFTKVCLDHGAMINESCTPIPHSMRSDVDLHAASPVAQNKQGRVQDLGRGFCPISIIQSPQTSHFATSKQLSILQCNINGLCSTATKIKLEEIMEIAEKQKIQIIALQETKLNEKYNLKYKNYNILRKDRNKEGGGLAFLIKNLYYEDIAINIPNTSDLEAQGIKVYLNQNKTINIFNMYHPPNNKLIDDGTMAQFLTDNTIIVGDLNAKHQLWGCSTPNPRGKILSNLFDDNAFMCLNDGNPTHHSYSYNTAQALDISFSSPDIFHKCKWQILKSIGSDHLPILIEISTKTKTSSIKEKFWNFKKANWNLYQQNTNEDFRKAPTRIKDLEQNWISFKNTIIKAAKVSIPRGNIKKWIPNYTHQAKDIQTLITKRNELQKKYTQNQTNCRTELNIVNAKIKRLYVNMKREKWKQTCENLNPRNPNTKLWHLAKQIDRAQPQTENTNMIKNIDGTPATNDKNAANLLGNSYQISSKIKFEIKDKKVEKKARKIIHDCKNVTSTHNIFHEKINMKELDYALENTDLNKTPGPDGIHEKLLDIFNNSWKTGKLPQDWKTATIIPIKKLDKSADDPKNYRPISLTSICCKLMEKIILRRLTYHLDTRNLLPEEQYGFRKGHGTIDQLLFFTQKVKDAQNRKPTNHTIAAFLDLTQAFDKVWKNKLITKLYKHFKIDGKAITWINDFLKNRYIRVKYNGTLSKTFKLYQGLPQGSVLSPTLFTLFIAGIEEKISHKTNIGLFADDIILWSSNTNWKKAERDLNKTLFHLEKFANKHKLEFNPQKSESCLFTTDKKLYKIRPKIILKEQQLQYNKHPKYLGFTLDPEINSSKHIEEVIRKGRDRLKILKYISGREWGADATTLKLTYTSLIRPILEYGYQIYGTASETNLKSLERIQLSAARIITGLRNTCLNDIVLYEADIMPLKDRRSYNLPKYINKIKSYGNKHRTSKYILNWESNLRLKKEGPLHLAKRNEFLKYKVEKNYLAEKNSPCKPLQNVIFNATLNEPTNKQYQNPEYLKQLSLEIINNIPKNAITIYTDGSRNELGHTGSGCLIKTTNGIEKMNRRNPDFCSVFRSELIAIYEALKTIRNTNYQDIWILTDSRSAIQHLSHTGELRDKVSRNIIGYLQKLSKTSKIHLQWIPSHVGIEGNEAADVLAKKGTKEHLPQKNKLTFKEIETIAKTRINKNWRIPPKHSWYSGVNPGGALNIRNRQHQTTLTRFRTGHLKPLKIENNNKIYPTCPKCSLVPAAPEHILACIRCTKQDLWERPLLIIKQLEEHELMEFV